MKSKHFFKVIAILSVTVMMLSTTPLQASAYVTNNETESNNTYNTADVTYDDYNNYGTISSATDVDWWTVTMTTNGFGAIWLGNIPSGCDYDIYLYESDGNKLLAYSEKAGRNQEYIRARFYANIPVLVKVVSSSGYNTSSQYLLRFKNYPIGKSRVFTYRYSDFDPSDTANTTETSQSAVNMRLHGFNSTHYLNNSANAVSTVLTNSQFILIHGHGGPGRMKLKNSRLYAQNNPNITSSDRTLSNYASGDLSELQMFIFSGCETGNDDENFGNLVDTALSKGARLALGFTQIIYTFESTTYMNYFTGTLDGCSVEQALADTDEWFRLMGYDGNMLDYKYWGLSFLESVNFA